MKCCTHDAPLSRINGVLSTKLIVSRLMVCLPPTLPVLFLCTTFFFYKSEGGNTFASWSKFKLTPSLYTLGAYWLVLQFMGAFVQFGILFANDFRWYRVKIELWLGQGYIKVQNMAMDLYQGFGNVFNWFLLKFRAI